MPTIPIIISENDHNRYIVLANCLGKTHKKIYESGLVQAEKEYDRRLKLINAEKKAYDKGLKRGQIKQKNLNKLKKHKF